MTATFSPDLHAIISDAQAIAIRFRVDYLDAEHVMLAILERTSSDAHQILLNLGVNFRKFRCELENLMVRGEVKISPKHPFPHANRFRKVFNRLVTRLNPDEHNVVTTATLLEYLADDSIVSNVFRITNISPETVKQLTRTWPTTERPRD
jgi:ATP-dependent Clp protease ATP-binding subunit ClpA